MSKSDKRTGGVKSQRLVKLSIRLKRELYDRMRAAALGRGFLTIAEWARSVVIAATEK